MRGSMSAELFLAHLLGVAKHARRGGRQLLASERQVKLASFDQVPELDVRPRRVEQVRGRVHQALGALEQVGRLGVLSGVEGVAARVGGGTGAGFLLLGLRSRRGRGK